MKSLMTCLLLLLTTGAIASDEPLWAALRDGGHVALMRHAPAPGIGDPAGFVLGDCSTQRNLSPAGREQAVATGERMRAAHHPRHHPLESLVPLPRHRSPARSRTGGPDAGTGLLLQRA